MRRFVLVIVVAITACDQTPRRPLAELTGSALQLYVNNIPTYDPFFSTHPVSGLDVLLDTPGCVSLSDDAHADFGGAPMEIIDAYADGGDCSTVAIHATLDNAVFDSPPAVLTIADSSATWTVTIPGLDDDITLAPLVASGTTTITWEHGPRIHDVFLNVGSVMIDSDDPWTAHLLHLHDNSVDVDLPSPLDDPANVHIELGTKLTLDPTVDAHGASCVGPSQCYVYEFVFQWMGNVDVTGE